MPKRPRSGATDEFNSQHSGSPSPEKPGWDQWEPGTELYSIRSSRRPSRARSETVSVELDGDEVLKESEGVQVEYHKSVALLYARKNAQGKLTFFLKSFGLWNCVGADWSLCACAVF